MPEHNMIKLYETSLTPYAEIPIIMMIMLIINYAPSILFNNNIRKTIFKSKNLIAHRQFQLNHVWFQCHHQCSRCMHLNAPV